MSVIASASYSDQAAEKRVAGQSLPGLTVARMRNVGPLCSGCGQLTPLRWGALRRADRRSGPEGIREYGPARPHPALFTSAAPARATQDALGLAHGAGEVRWAARLAEHYGSGTRAVLKVLGRGALVLVGRE
jgi:hypothetical protein